MSETTYLPEKNVLSEVRVRLLLPEERQQFDRLMEQEHYLHSARIGGQSLRYVAEVGGQWVGLVAFSGASPHIKARDRKIGWSGGQRARRLHFVVNNSRFLVLMDRGRYPNLASRVLGLCLRRLSDDWQQAWGHPVLMVESFVDETRYRGTCYRACGFEAVGLSAGYGRSSRDYYLKHGHPKQLYLKELVSGAMELLRSKRLPAPLAKYEQRIDDGRCLRGLRLRSLYEEFEKLGDKRRGHGLRHPQPFVLACAAVGFLLGAGGYEALEEVCGRLSPGQLKILGGKPDPKTGKYKAPSDSTFFRVLNGLDVEEFDRVVGRWFAAQEPEALESVAVDGKCLRGSGRSDGKPLHLLSAVTHRLRLTLGQEAVAEKSNEITAFKPLLEKLPKEQMVGSLITADALHCQQEAARYVTQELGADYLFGLKGNQSGILERAEQRLPEEFFSP